MTKTSRRDFLKQSALGAAALALPGVARTAAPEQTSPPARQRMNVLFIACDDLKPVLGCFGDKLVKTPNIDRLAARGMVFRRAYCQQAVCAPSRNSLLTSLHPETIGIYDLATFFRTKVPDAVTLPQHFKANGYETASLGKIFHTGHGNHDDQLSWSVPSWRPKSGMYALAENRTGQQTRAAAAIAKGAPKGKPEALPKGAPTECADVDDNAYSEGKIAQEAIRRLDAYRKSGQLFFLAVGFLKPHLPFCAPKRYWDLYQRSDFKLPEMQTLPKGAPALAGNGLGEMRTYSDIPEVGPVGHEKALELIHGYYATVSYVDAQVGKVLDALDRSGLARNTVIAFWGDHGWHLGDHGLWCKHTNFEQAAHAPLIVGAPGLATAGAQTDRLVEFVDIYPTLCDLCGLDKPAALEGTSFVPLLKDPGRPWKKGAFHVWPRAVKGEGNYMGCSVRTERYRLVEWKTPKSQALTKLELYDYQQDPEETVNLANDPAHAKIVSELTDLLHKGWRAARPD